MSILRDNGRDELAALLEALERRCVGMPWMDDPTNNGRAPASVLTPRRIEAELSARLATWGHRWGGDGSRVVVKIYFDMATRIATLELRRADTFTRLVGLDELETALMRPYPTELGKEPQ